MATGARRPGGSPLPKPSKPDQDWTEIEVVFNSLDSSEITVYLGVWGGLKGSLWLDDWKLEELSLVNVLRARRAVRG